MLVEEELVKATFTATGNTVLYAYVGKGVAHASSASTYALANGGGKGGPGPGDVGGHWWRTFYGPC